MSGWNKDGSYDLTHTVAMRWHRRHDACRIHEGSVGDPIEMHLRASGLQVVGHGSFWRVTGGSLLEGWPDDLWTALSGRPAERRPYLYSPYFPRLR